MAEDDLSPRERRAQRIRNRPSGKAPADWGRRLRVIRGPLIVIVLLAAVGGAIVWLQHASSDCPDHWHGTQATFVPFGEQTIPGGYNVPHRIDWSSPKAANGREYYDYGTDPKMSISVHMHQSADSKETGSTALGPAQFHFEGNGKCVGIQNAFSAIDMDVAPGHVAVIAGSPLANANPGGPYNDHGNQTLRFFLQSKEGGHWVWHERSLGDYIHYQLHDGESMVLAFGHYSDSQIQDMMNQVPAPTSRPAGDPSDPWYTAPASGTTTSPTT